MAENAPITSAHEWHIGEDRVLEFTVVDANDVPIDVALFNMEWMLKRRVTDLDGAALLRKTAVVTGVYNISPLLNTQRVTVFIVSADTDGLRARQDYRHELKRIDLGFETVLSYGTAVLKRGVVHGPIDLSVVMQEQIEAMDSVTGV